MAADVTQNIQGYIKERGMRRDDIARLVQVLSSNYQVHHKLLFCVVLWRDFEYQPHTKSSAVLHNCLCGIVWYTLPSVSSSTLAWQSITTLTYMCSCRMGGGIVQGYAQMANLVQSWLEIAGDSHDDIREHMQRYVKQHIKDTFDTDKAAALFEQPNRSKWLPELIRHAEWRALVYDLAADHPASLMLNYVIKLIADAGHRDEIADIGSIANALGVFSSVLTDFVVAVVVDPTVYARDLPKLRALACASLHTFTYCQMLLHASMHSTGAWVLLLPSCGTLMCATESVVVEHFLLYSTAYSVVFCG